jgi:hypothetical protein
LKKQQPTDTAVIRERLRTRAAAKYIGKSESWMEKARLSGTSPPYYKIGGSVIYDTADLDEYLAAHRRISTSDNSKHLGGARLSRAICVT